MTRHRFANAAVKTWLIAAFKPSWASGNDQLDTTQSPARQSPEDPQNVLGASGGAVTPKKFPACPVLLTPLAIIAATDTTNRRFAHFQIGASSQKTVFPPGPLQKRLHALVDVPAKADHLTLGDARHAERLTSPSTLRRHPADPRFLDDHRQCPFRVGAVPK